MRVASDRKLHVYSISFSRHLVPFAPLSFFVTSFYAEVVSVSGILRQLASDLRSHIHSFSQQQKPLA